MSEQAGQGPRYIFRGSDLDITWDERLCIHVGECTRAEPKCFGGGKPWGRPDDASPPDVVAIVERCPSGALTYERNDDGPEESPLPENTVTVSSRGPLFLTGALSIEGAPEDMPGTSFRAALCRCGASKNKPFCDNSHQEIGFDDQGAIGTTGPGGSEDGGPLDVKPAKNGPLLLEGRFTMISGSGRVAWRGHKAALCRCGASENKPFCDGAHKKCGFEG